MSLNVQYNQFLRQIREAKQPVDPVCTSTQHVPCNRAKPLTLLLGDTDGPSATASSLGVLATDAKTPVVTKTSVCADLLESLEVLTELGVDTVGQDLEVLAVDNVALPVEEPGGDLVLGGVLDDGDNALKLFRGKLTGAVICALERVIPSADSSLPSWRLFGGIHTAC